MEQEQHTLPENLSSLPVFSGVRVTRSLVLYICFVDRCLSLCIFSFGHCVVCSSTIYGFCLPFGVFKLCIIIVIARLRVVESDNLDEYKCLLLLNLFAASYNKTRSGNVYLMTILCKSQLFNTFILLCFSPLF